MRLAFRNETCENQLFLEISTLSWYLGNLVGTAPGPENCEDMCIGIPAYHRDMKSDLGPQSLLVISDTASPASFGRAKKIKPFVDWHLVKTWLQVCETHYTTGCHHDPAGLPAISGLKLIDCQTRTVIKATAGAKWVALSYVWSLATQRLSPFSSAPSSTPPSPAQQGGLALFPDNNVLPGTIIDAIEATLALGYRYLWADQFCIDQSNRGEVIDQVGKMDKIYRGAALTIVAISARSGLPGSSFLSRTEPKVVSVRGGENAADFYVASMDPIGDINASIWMTRGWCYQEEMLSRRLLFFTEGGVWFACNETTCYEAICGPEVPLSLNDDSKEKQQKRKKIEEHGMRLKKGNLQREGNMLRNGYVPRETHHKLLLDRCLAGKGSGGKSIPTARYHVLAARRVIGEYTKKKLSFDIDSLTAMSGVLNVFGQLDSSPIQFCQGLPVSDDLSGRFVENLLIESLCWYHMDRGKARRREHLPSWSWAGWSGTILWPRLPLQGFDEHPLRRAKLADWRGFSAKFEAKVLAIAGGCDSIASLDYRDTIKGEFHYCRLSDRNCRLSTAKAILFEARVVPPSFFVFRKSTRQDVDGESYEKLVLHVDDSHPREYEHYSVYADLLGDLDDVLTKHTGAKGRVDPQEFLDRIRKGQLECVFLGEQLESNLHVSIHLLVLEWKADGVAERFDQMRFVFEWDAVRNRRKEYRNALFSQTKGLEKKFFWLV